MEIMQHKTLGAALVVVVVMALSVLVVSYSVPEKEFQAKKVENPQRASHEQKPQKFQARITSSTPDVSFPPESSNSNDPAELVIASGTVLETQTHALASDRQWTRVRLVKTGAQPRPVRVVERWEAKDGMGALISREMFLADQVLISAAPGVNKEKLQKSLESAGIVVLDEIAPGHFTLRLPSSEIDAIPQALEVLAAHPDLVKSAEGDGIGFGSGVPNDPGFVNQWGHNNTGQFGGSVVGTDVRAPDFWGTIENTSGLVIAVLDSGLNLLHPDLQNVAWVNPQEIAGNRVDDDANGRVDDINGWDFVNLDNNPTDDHGHGSNVSGIIAANRGNAVGIAGLIPGAKIMVGKILNSSNSGLTSNLIAGLAFARQKGVSIINLSLQNYNNSTLLSDEITACEAAGILLVISAGNQGTNNDTIPNYPSSYPNNNIISVGSHSLDNTRWAGTPNPSNFGATSVDLLAPGRFIYSTHLTTTYQYFTGSSQAAAYVTAVCGAIKYVNPSWTAAEIKSLVMSSVVTTTLYQGSCVSGGRLDAVKALAKTFLATPEQDTDKDGFPNLIEYLSGSRIDESSIKPQLAHEVVGGFFRVSIPAVSRPEATLQVESSTNLVDWGTAGLTDFSVPGVVIAGTPLNTSPLSGNSRTFLRVKAVPSPQ